MNGHERYRMFAAYNAWANERIYDAAAKLTDSDYRADRGAFFKSMHGTLNHMLVADRIWMRRFTERRRGAATARRNLFDSLPARDAAAREAEDRRIHRVCRLARCREACRDFTYRTITNPTTVIQPLAPALDHFFNHHTHHRGQLHCLLTAISAGMTLPLPST